MGGRENQMITKRLKPMRPVGLLGILLFALALFLCPPAEAKERGFWGGVKASFAHAARQTGVFFKEANRAFLRFFRHDVKEAGKEIGKGAVGAGKETGDALKETGAETKRELKRSAQEAKRNFKQTDREIREGLKDLKGKR